MSFKGLDVVHCGQTASETGNCAADMVVRRSACSCCQWHFGHPNQTEAAPGQTLQLFRIFWAPDKSSRVQVLSIPILEWHVCTFRGASPSTTCMGSRGQLAIVSSPCCILILSSSSGVQGASALQQAPGEQLNAQPDAVMAEARAPYAAEAAAAAAPRPSSSHPVATDPSAAGSKPVPA